MVLISAATSSIGRELAHQYALRNCKLVLTCWDKEELEDLVFHIKLRHSYKDVVAKVANHTKHDYH